jgi:putative tryptophan/tyrosine transport system substrate-binding protein
MLCYGANFETRGLQMRRREFIAGLGAAGGHAAMPRFARARQDARVRRLAMLVVLVQNEAEMEHAISAFAAEPDGGLLPTGANSSTIFGEIGRLALYHHLPSMYGGVAQFAAGSEGVLMANGPDFLDLARRASSYVDRILRSAKPSALPVQYPTQFEPVVNLKTAKAVGVTIPETFLAHADQVIE